MDWLGFLGSIISGIIGGLFTFLGVKVTIKNDDKETIQDELYMHNVACVVRINKGFSETDVNRTRKSLKSFNPQSD